MKNRHQSQSGVVFMFQSAWQKSILNKYGSNICLVDSTYNTTVYDLPLFCVCVPTNCGYVTVATCVLSDETSETFESALKKVAQWNPDWHPKHFMSDFNEGQISAIERTFPG